MLSSSALQLHLLVPTLRFSVLEALISLSLLFSCVTPPAVLSFPPTSQGPGLGGNEPPHTPVANISEQLCLSALLLLLLNSEQKWTVYLTQ